MTHATFKQKQAMDAELLMIQQIFSARFSGGGWCANAYLSERREAT